VVEVRCGRGFTLKALDELLIQAELCSQYLERYLALEERIYGSVHTSHAATAQLGANLVAPDPAPGEISHAVRSFPSNLSLGTAQTSLTVRRAVWSGATIPHWPRQRQTVTST